MDKLASMNDTQYIFGWIFTASNKIDTLLQREFDKFDITTKQWFLSVILDNLFDAPPTIKELANEMGSSHQNIKQIALKLEQKGLLKLEKDKSDARTTRLILTEKSFFFWRNLQDTGIVFKNNLFKNISNEDLSVTRRVMKKILENSIILDKERDK